MNRPEPLDDNTTLHPRRSQDIGIPATFMINDLGTPLSADKGLFVYTTPTGQSGILIVDADGLVTLPSVTIGTGTGNRFILTVPS